MKKKIIIVMAGLLFVVSILQSCMKEDIISGGHNLEDWSDETHGYNATPNYAVVFNQNEVQRIDIVIEPEYWAVMQEDLEEIVAAAGTAPGDFSEETPIYVPCQMYYNGIQWYDVGIRYKGNSSLTNASEQGVGKLPFRLETNHFENENPNINGQTFYGFTQLSLSSNYKDNSYLHEKVAADILREFGIPAAQTAFYRIYIDYGNGPVYFGLYTMVEIIFDTMLDTQFGSSSGNCYKPDSDGGRLNDLQNINTTYFPNKTNSGASLDDIVELVSVIISDTRTTNPSQWKQDLESIFDVDHFLKWLAANTTLMNWDVYGRAPHNYYLYKNPSNNLFTWIPWDHNSAFSINPNNLAFNFSNMQTTPISSSGDVAWPLVSYLYSDSAYRAKYNNYIDEFITTVFTVSNLSTKFTEFHDMIQPYVTGAEGEISGYSTLTSQTAFDNSVTELINIITQRIIDADAYTP